MKATSHYHKLQAMGFPPGSNYWCDLEIDTRYSEWRRRQNRRMFWAVAICVIIGGLSVYMSIGGV